MIKHVVLWKFKEENKQENMEKARKMLLALVGVIKEIRHMDVYFDISHTDASMDMMLDTEFLSAEELRVYAIHPEHLKVADFMRVATEKRVVIDSEI